MNIKDRQLKVLRAILSNADESEFGILYKIKSWVNKPDLYKLFSENIPSYNYDLFYELWINKALTSKSKILFNQFYRYLAFTSGTGNLLQKYLPYSNAFIASMMRSSRSLIFRLMRLGISPFLFTRKVLTIGGSTSFDQYHKVIVENNFNENLTAGFMSGIIFKESPKWYRSMYLPKPQIHAMTDWKAKMDIIIDEAPTYNVGTLTGFPSYVLPLLNSIIIRYNLNSIHDIWPELGLYIHSGVAIDQYKIGFERCFGKHVDYFETYYASEGFFGFSTSLNSDIMQLNLGSNIFYEFAEVNSTNFNDKNELNRGAEVLPLWNIQNNKRYALLVTNKSGLYRIVQGDVLIFSDVEKLHFKLDGRTSEMMNGSGEIIPVIHFTNSFLDYCRLYNTSNFIDFFISTEKENGKTVYNWFIVTDKLNIEVFENLDEFLQNQIILYKSYRDAGINMACMIHFIKESQYDEFLYSINKKNGQSKMPKFLKGELKLLFKNYLINISE